MPSLGADMESGTVTEWRVSPGDAVHRGQIVAVVETDKADIDVEVFEDGVITEILVPAGREVAVGTPLAIVGAQDAAFAPPRPAPIAPPVTPPAPAPISPVARPAPPPPRIASPLVRHLAESLAVDVGSITPTGPERTVRRRDVEQAAARARTAPTGGRVAASPYARRRAGELGIDLAQVAVGGRPIRAADLGDNMRKPIEGDAAPPQTRTDRQQRAVARLMERSKREIPHYYLNHQIDCSPLLAWLAETNLSRPVAQRVLPAAALLRAVVIAAGEHPEFNGHYTDGGHRPSRDIDLGVAIALREGGLLAPTIAAADALTLEGLMAAMRDLVTRVRRGELRSSDLEPATLTVTNLGDQGVEALFGVIVPPQVAIVGFGRILERPWAVDGLLGVKPVVTVALSADHRVSDGHRGSRFLKAIERALNEPEVLR